MIQIYKASNLVYERNGDAILSPLKCEVDSKTWELELVNPLDEWMPLIQEGAVLKVPDFVGKEQLYRIYRKRKSDTGVTAYARPIFMDSADDLFIYDQRPTDVNAQAALDILTKGTKYKAVSNIAKKNTAYYVRKNLMDALLGTDENSFINRWGGEPVYDNYTIYLNERAGLDRGVSVEFGLNMQSVEEDVDMDNVITRIVPVSYNGYTLENNGYVDSSNINKYPKIYTREVIYSDVKLQEDCGEDEVGFTNLTALRTELIRRAKLDFANGADKPKITYSIDMVDLSYTNEYKGLKDLVNVSLGDTVKCRNRRLDIETTSRVTSLIYDCIMQRTKSIVLGNNELNIFDRYTQTYDAVSNVIDPETNSLIAEKIKGIIDAMQTTFRYQQTVAKRQNVRAILFEDTDPSSPLYGATCIGSAGVEFSNHRTPDGRDWDWTTAINANGILAPAVITGILSDKLGKTYWNLDTGELVTKNMKASNAELSGTIKGSAITGGSISGTTIRVGNNFSVDKDGKIIAKEGDFTGTVTAGSGNIAGFLINGNSLSKTQTTTYDYTTADAERIKNIILGNTTPSAADYARLDITGDDAITAQDYAIIKNMVEIYGNKLNSSISISNNTKDGYITVKNNTSGLTIFKIGYHSVNVNILSAASQVVTGNIVSPKGDLQISSSGIVRSSKNIWAPGFRIDGTGASRSIACKWADGDTHDILSIGSDNLNNYHGPASGIGETVTNLRGKYVKLYNHEGGYCRVNGSAITSDKNLKYDFRSFDEKHEELFMLLMPKIYKYETGTSKRDHFGFVAQDVEQALENAGMSTDEFAGVIIDKEIARSEDDTDVNTLIDKGLSEMHLLRMEEFIALNTHMLQKAYKKIEALEQKVSVLEKKIKEEGYGR